MIFAVAGHPVAHSKSPYIFNTHFQSTGMDASYTAFAADNAAEIAGTMRELGVRGMNVTAPYKESVIQYCDTVSDEARALDSVNTLVNDDGTIHGYTTDGYGVTRTIGDVVGLRTGRRALLIGAGGAGRMAAEALHGLGIAFTVVNRTFDKARKLADMFQAEAVRTDDVPEVCRHADIVINTLPAGASLFPGSLLKPGSYLLDAVYTENRFRSEAQANGVRIIPGEAWLLHQAHGAAHHFFGQGLTKRITTASLARYRRDVPGIIALTGFMGSGKTSVAQELSRITELPLLDIDDEIVHREGTSIGNIFKEKGEPYFRDREARLLLEIAESGRRLILSCGGGIISNDRNNRILKEKTYTVWLYAPMDVSFERIHDSGRPLARNGYQKFTDLFRERKERYALSSDLLVINHQKTPESCARRIHEEISRIISH
ncbi:MAG: shikimate kinase [Spirochaetota bacterium]